MSAEKFDYSRFTVRAPIKALPEKVFKSWITQEALESWFLRLAEFKKADGSIRDRSEAIVPGDTYRWLWHGWPDSTEERGKIMENNGKDFLKFTFGKAGVVSVEVIRKDDITIVELIQDEIPPFETAGVNYHVECKTGWTFYLANLNSVLQGGVDLRNKDQNLQLD